MAAARALMPAMSDIHSPYSPWYPPSLLLLIFSNVNALMAGMDGAVHMVRVLAKHTLQVYKEQLLLALRESSCDVLGALNLQLVVANVQTHHHPTSDSGIRDSNRGW